MTGRTSRKVIDPVHPATPDEVPANSAAATLIINDRNEVLLLKRGSTAPWMPNMWNLPGGKIDPGEMPVEAAVREAKEETGIEVSDLILVQTRSEDWGTLYLYFADSWEGVAEKNWESSMLLWVSPRAALASPLVPGLMPLFKEMQRQDNARQRARQKAALGR
jgi:8-oxo-dGTP diphosphatase